MKQVYRSYPRESGMIGRRLNEDIRVSVNSKGKLQRITLMYKPLEEDAKVMHWGNYLNEEWDFNEACESDLVSVFTQFALKSPEEFKKLYLMIKENDPAVFPAMQRTLEEVKQMFNFE